MVPLNLVLRGGTHPSRPRGSGDQRALIRRENIFPRRYRVFQANCSNTTIDYTCTFTGAKRSRVRRSFGEEHRWGKKGEGRGEDKKFKNVHVSLVLLLSLVDNFVNERKTFLFTIYSQFDLLDIQFTYPLLLYNDGSL